MQPQGVRRSSRITERIPITLIGGDRDGNVVLEETHTLLISRHGAGVVSRYQLAPEQELLIRLPDANKEAPVRVIGQEGEEGSLFVYGVAFLNADVPFWNREFSAPREARQWTLECDRCKNQETIETSDLDDDIYAFNDKVVRYCNECRSSTVWKKCSGPRKAAAAFLGGEALTENRRKHHRAKATFRACIRRPGFEDDIVACEDASRGGVRFKSRKRYLADTPIEIAVPYSSGSASIFSPAQILYVQELEQQNAVRCGVAYTKSGQ